MEGLISLEGECFADCLILTSLSLGTLTDNDSLPCLDFDTPFPLPSLRLVFDLERPTQVIIVRL